MSPELLSPPFGTEIFDGLTQEQRHTLSQAELCNFFSITIHGERDLLAGVVPPPERGTPPTSSPRYSAPLREGRERAPVVLRDLLPEVLRHHPPADRSARRRLAAPAGHRRLRHVRADPGCSRRSASSTTRSWPPMSASPRSSARSTACTTPTSPATSRSVGSTSRSSTARSSASIRRTGSASLDYIEALPLVDRRVVLLAGRLQAGGPEGVRDPPAPPRRRRRCGAASRRPSRDRAASSASCARRSSRPARRPSAAMLSPSLRLAHSISTLSHLSHAALDPALEPERPGPA